MSDSRDPFDLLSAPPPDRRTRSDTERWVRDPGHTKAATFVHEWLERRAAGTTEWRVADVHRHLTREHGFPFGLSTFQKWLQSYRTDEYEAAR